MFILQYSSTQNRKGKKNTNSEVERAIVSDSSLIMVCITVSKTKIKT